MFKVLRTPLILLSCMAISACGSSEPRVVVKTEMQFLFPPEAYLTCKDDPEPPADNATKGDNAQYKIDLWVAGDDCRQDVKGVAKWVADAKARIAHDASVK